MTTLPVAQPGRGVEVSPDALSRGRIALVLGLTVVLGLLAYYLVGLDEGMTSLFGRTMILHEWAHDARHLIGFPCH
jgi:hypothetical protein